MRITTGYEVLKENITAAKLVADLFSSSFGPAGMAKLLLMDNGDFKVTRDAEIISSEVAFVHPVAKLLMEAGTTCRKEGGDGFITTVVLAALLVERGWRLANNGIHPALTATGYQLALKEALKIIDIESSHIDFHDYSTLKKIAKNHLATKLPLSWAEHLAPIVVSALIGVSESVNGYTKFDLDMIKVDGRRGASVEDSELVDGVILHKKGVDRLMPKTITDAKIAFIQEKLGIKRPDMFTKVVLSTPNKIKDFYSERLSYLRDFLDPLLRIGVNVVLCGGDIAEELRRPLANCGILAVRNVALEDMKRLRMAVGGELVMRPWDLNSQSLGYCGRIDQRIVAAHDEWLFFKNCRNPHFKSILVRGTGDFVVDEVKRAIINCLKLLQSLLKNGAVVAGGGFIEYKIAHMLRKLALSYPSKIQQTVQVFADALEELPLWLVRNTGGDPANVKGKLRSCIAANMLCSIDGYTGEVIKSSITEPAIVKIQCLKSATETAVTILRIDHVFQQPPKPQEKKSPIPLPVRMVRGWK